VVTSAIGVGTTFTLWLAALPAAAPTASVAPLVTAWSAPRRSILVIDDDPGIGKVIARTLKNTDDVTHVASARDALARLATGDRYDVILCDLMMPDIDGPKFHELLRGIAPEMLARTAFITGGVSSGPTASFLARAATRALAKPFTKDELRAFIAEISTRSV
jgi:CheY-like chemotaxis protein